MAKEHVPALALLERACFSEPWTEKQLAEELGNPAARFLVCLMDGEVAGYVGCHAVAGTAYIANVAVFPAFRRRGVGRALIGALADRCGRAGDTEITLEVRESNAPARALYGAFGFAVAGRRPRFYRAPEEDGLILTLSLTPDESEGSSFENPGL